MKEAHTEPAPLRFREKIAYGLGQVNDLYMNNFLGTIITPVYNIALKMPLDLLGYAIAMPRLFDAITDPAIGGWSDNFRSRWGRRKPFMLAGALLGGAALIGIWTVPPAWGIYAMFAYLVILSCVYYLGTTMFLVPFTALGYGMASGYRERTNLFAYRSMVDIVGGFVIPWSYSFITMSCFASTVEGAQVLSAIIAAGYLIFCLIPVCFCNERGTEPPGPAGMEKTPLLKSLRVTLGNRMFLRVALAVMCMFFGFFATGALTFYLNVYYIFDGSEKAVGVLTGIGGSVWKLLALAALPLAVYLGNRFGKRQIFCGALLLAGTACLSNWFLLVPEHPYWQLAVSAFLGPAMMAVLLFMNSMIADICDLDELEHGVRREAMFAAMNTWFTKVGISVAMAFSGILVMATGFRSEDGCAQSARTFVWMRLLCAVLPALGMFAGAALIWKYPLSEAALKQAKERLAKKQP